MTGVLQWQTGVLLRGARRHHERKNSRRSTETNLEEYIEFPFHAHHPSNDQKLSLAIRFRRVLTIVSDGIRFLDFGDSNLDRKMHICAKMLH